MSPEIIFITSFPPVECGIATFSNDLISALKHQFSQTFTIKVALVDTENTPSNDPMIGYRLNPKKKKDYEKLAEEINVNKAAKAVVVQHEFGFYHTHETDFEQLLQAIHLPVVLVFHTVLPKPDKAFKRHVCKVVDAVAMVVVMTQSSKTILTQTYGVAEEKITVIPHGTHLILEKDKEVLKSQLNLAGKTILSTFGLINSGKNIETTLQALPAIIAKNPSVVFLIIGKTHPNIQKLEGEAYREKLLNITKSLGIEANVRFINRFLSLPELIDYLQLTDVYLFTSNDPNQAVSGTFAYALSCGCPIVSTPIPHAVEVIDDEMGKIIPFNDVPALSETVNNLLANPKTLAHIRDKVLHYMANTSWQNVANGYARLIQQVLKTPINLVFNWPEINLNHVQNMTTEIGMIQFSKLGEPDLESGFTLDDNARALIAVCAYYDQKKTPAALELIETYLGFIEFCLQEDGSFLNYVDKHNDFTSQNQQTNILDSNGRAVWGLGFLISLKDSLPEGMVLRAQFVLNQVIPTMNNWHSTRSMSFAIKGMAYYYAAIPSVLVDEKIRLFANRLVQFYRHESSQDWKWFESYLTYANSLIPEALLCAYQVTGNSVYRNTAKESFDFLLDITYTGEGIKVISNKSWLKKGEIPHAFGEQPIDVAYTILALNRFYKSFHEERYLHLMATAFDWFLGANHLHRIIYNPCTGGCLDGLEEDHVNLNQGAESTVSYLICRLEMEGYQTKLAEMRNQFSVQPTADSVSTMNQAIIKLSVEVMEENPALYEHLSETPMYTSPNPLNATLNASAEYLEFLKLELAPVGSRGLKKVKSNKIKKNLKN